jgi:hypothetical protein
MLRSPCVLNAAGGASDTPVATPCEPYRVKYIQKYLFLRARALSGNSSGMAFAELFNTHFCRRSRDLSIFTTVFWAKVGRRCALYLEVLITSDLCTPWVDQALGSKREVIFRDGCSADFKCAGLLLWLSMARGMRWAWNWFASCHGKTDECDAGGGTYIQGMGSRCTLLIE